MNFQIGKNGLTEGVITSLGLGFKKRPVIRISVLRSAEPTKEKLRAMADELVARLEGEYDYTLVGFTIILRKLKTLKK